MDTSQNQLKNPRFILTLVGVILLAGIIIVSMLRDRIVAPPYNQVTITGEGRVSYTPDVAIVNLGVRAIKSPTAEAALTTVNQKMNAIITVVTETLGVPMEDVQTQALSLYPEYDYIEGVSRPGGYTANQQISIKVRNLGEGSNELVSRIISESSKAGANEVLGVTFEPSNLGELKQQARIKAIEDAKGKSKALADASGVKLKKVVSWYENFVQPYGPYQQSYFKEGMGGGSMSAVPSGLQEVVVEVGLNYSLR
jgi:uncharacterized protein